MTLEVGDQYEVKIGFFLKIQVEVISIVTNPDGSKIVVTRQVF